MTEIICAVVAAIATIICAWIASSNAKLEKARKRMRKKASSAHSKGARRPDFS